MHATNSVGTHISERESLSTHEISPSFSRRLTTAESLVLEIVVAHCILGAPFSVLSNAHWIRPQLDSLQELQLLTWEFDANADFLITPSSHLLDHPAAADIHRRLHLHEGARTA
jgi:hypothetical protein